VRLFGVGLIRDWLVVGEEEGEREGGKVDGGGRNREVGLAVGIGRTNLKEKRDLLLLF
jgi:hypothetical protein